MKLMRLCPALATALLLTLLALPASATTAEPVEAPASVTAPDLGLDEPEALELAPPLCKPPENTTTTVSFFPFFSGDCQASCTAACEDRDGFLLDYLWDPRGARCDCTCCVPR